MIRYGKKTTMRKCKSSSASYSRTVANGSELHLNMIEIFYQENFKDNVLMSRGKWLENSGHFMKNYRPIFIQHASCIDLTIIPTSFSNVHWLVLTKNLLTWWSYDLFMVLKAEFLSTK